MPNIMHIASNMTLGEIDQKLLARVDLDILNKGLKYARDVHVIPQGGVRRRFGTKKVAECTICTSKEYAKTFLFEYADGTKYLLLFESASLKIYYNNALVAALVTPYTAVQISSLRAAQSSDKVIVVHPDLPPYALEVVTLPGAWTFAPIAFTYYPTQDFEHNYDSITFYPNTAHATQITAGVALFTTNHVGGLFFGNEGTFRITGFTSTTVVTGFCVDDFKDTTPISGKLAILTEPAFSLARGYPRAVTFFQDRSCFASTEKIVNGVWMSKINNFNNFDDSESLATSAIGIYIDSVNIVRSILAEKAFLIFATKGVVATQYLADTPIKPDNVVTNVQNNNGIGDVEPIIYDDKVVYVDYGGKIVWGISYNVQKGGQTASDLSIMSQHLIKQPIEMIPYRSPKTDNANYLFLINSDGTIASLQSVDEQNVLGWSLLSTDGYFRHGCSSHDSCYFIVEREINGVTKFYIEQVDFDLTLDCSYVHTYGAPTTTVTGLGYLEGKTVQVFGDNKLQNEKVVTGGQITLDTAATDVIIGLNYVPKIVPLPVSVASQQGNNVYLPKRVKTLWVDYYQSLGIYIDGQGIPSMTTDVTLLDAELDLQTDVYAVTPMHGWEPRAEIEITQEQPYPMTIIGVGMEIEMGGF